MWLLFTYLIYFTSDPMVLSTFAKAEELNNWYVVDDGVMGGLSQGNLAYNDEGYAMYSGDISLDNYGGFSSIRKVYRKQEIAGYKHAILHVKVDGKKYQFRLKSSRRDYHSYVYDFKTGNEWEEIIIPLEEMRPQFRGRKLNMPDYDASYVSEMAILIGNKKVESFELLIKEITLQ